MVLDLGLRMRVHALMRALEEHRPRNPRHHTRHPFPAGAHRRERPARLPLVGLLRELDDALPPTSDLVVPSGACGCRCPGTTRRPTWPSSGTWPGPRRRPVDPVEHRVHPRVNGLDSVDDVSGPSSTPATSPRPGRRLPRRARRDAPRPAAPPRHDEVQPARTWTAENSVGIGGAYLCIYGMEGPGGTSSWAVRPRCGTASAAVGCSRRTRGAAVLRPDRVVPVSAEELLELRAETDAAAVTSRPRRGSSPSPSTRRSSPPTPTRSRRSARSSPPRSRREGPWCGRRGVRRPARTAPTVAAGPVDLPAGAVGVEAPSPRPSGRCPRPPGPRRRRGPRAGAGGDEDGDAVTAPVEGELLEVYVKPGEAVTAGQVLFSVPPWKEPRREPWRGRAGCEGPPGLCAHRAVRPARGVDRPAPVEDVLAEAASVDPDAPLAGGPRAVKDNIDVAAADDADGRPPPSRTGPTGTPPPSRGCAPPGPRARQDEPGPVRDRARRHAQSSRRCGNAFAPDRISGGPAPVRRRRGPGVRRRRLGPTRPAPARAGALHGLVGVKPTRGLVPNTGVVPPAAAWTASPSSPATWPPRGGSRRS